MTTALTRLDRDWTARFLRAAGSSVVLSVVPRRWRRQRRMRYFPGGAAIGQPIRRLSRGRTLVAFDGPALARELAPFVLIERFLKN